VWRSSRFQPFSAKTALESLVGYVTATLAKGGITVDESFCIALQWHAVQANAKAPTPFE
jgi:hypothetical protein